MASVQMYFVNPEFEIQAKLSDLGEIQLSSVFEHFLDFSKKYMFSEKHQGESPKSEPEWSQSGLVSRTRYSLSDLSNARRDAPYKVPG